jgi:hypothetical protein
MNRIWKGGHHSVLCTFTIIDLLISPLAYSFNKVQDLADRGVLKVTCFHKMMNQVLES